MPSKNSIKEYLENSYYHIYNRGVEKRRIFEDKQDYGVLLYYVKEYLLPKDDDLLLNQLSIPGLPWHEKSKILQLMRLNNFASEIDLVAYCLMPNHFHFLIRQRSSGSMDRFMNSLATRYTMYFNKRHNRVGPLYQDVYKAVLVNSDAQLLHLSRYIHKQAFPKGDAFESQPSSYPEYCGLRSTEWIKPRIVLDFFPGKVIATSYQTFVKDFIDPDFILRLTIEDIGDHF